MNKIMKSKIYVVILLVLVTPVAAVTLVHWTDPGVSAVTILVMMYLISILVALSARESNRRRSAANRRLFQWESFSFFCALCALGILAGFVLFGSYFWPAALFNFDYIQFVGAAAFLAVAVYLWTDDRTLLKSRADNHQAID